MTFDKRRRQYVPLDVFVAFDDFGTALYERWEMEGLCTWMLFLAACKREPVQGTFTFTTEAEGWGKLGASTADLTLDEFFTFSGGWKKTSKRRQGRVTYVQVTPKLWEKWNTVSRQKTSKTQGDTSTLAARNGHVTAPEVEGEVEGEREGTNGAHAPMKPSTPGAWQPAFGSRNPVVAIRQQINLGVLTDRVDLDAELAAHPAMTDQDRAALLTMLEEKVA